MDATTARHLAFLASAIVVSDARPDPATGPPVSVDKQAALYATLARHLADRTPAQQAQVLAGTLKKFPGFSGGIAFLRRVEQSARKVSAGLDVSAREAVLHDLAAIAEADGNVSFPELTLLRAIVAHLGLPGPPIEVDTVDGRVLFER